MPTDADADADADADEKTFCPAATICSVSVSTSAWFSSSSDRDQCHHWDISFMPRMLKMMSMMIAMMIAMMMVRVTMTGVEMQLPHCHLPSVPGSL